MSDLHTESWNILHIDDDEDDHIIVRSMLSEFHDRTITLDWASTFDEGQQKLFAKQYQAVLIDYDLGTHTGIDLIREAAGQGYNAPLILLTGRGSYKIDVEAMQAGATLYLNKNEVNAMLLERFIRYAIERKMIESNLRTSNEQLANELAQRLRVAEKLRTQ